MTNNQDIVLLAIRGTLNAPAIEESRTIHNETAGHPQGVAAARALGDLSHNVYVPMGDASELLILDTWNSVEGLGKFFADPNVQAGGGRIFKSRDAAVFTAADTYSFSLPSPRANAERYVGMIRGTVRSKEQALEVFGAATKTSLNKSRALGHVSHHMFWRVDPASGPTLDLLGIDIWHDAEGMGKWYESGPKHIYEVFADKPATSIWKQPAGSWVEW